MSEERRVPPANRGKDGGFFIFSDLSVKTEGEYRLKFVLWELLEYGLRFSKHCHVDSLTIRSGEIESLQSILSPPFKGGYTRRYGESC